MTCIKRSPVRWTTWGTGRQRANRKCGGERRPQITREGEKIPVSGSQAAINLAERKGQQARTQERKADRCQDQESVGDSVVVTHDTPTTPDARPNLLKLSESPCRNHVSNYQPENRVGTRTLAGQGSRPVTITFKCVGKKNPGAYQGHHRCNCLNHRTNPLRPRTPTERLQRCTVKKIHGVKSKIGGE